MARSYTVLVTAAVKERTVNFTVTIRYQSDVSMEMSYTVMEDGAAEALCADVREQEDCQRRPGL